MGFWLEEPSDLDNPALLGSLFAAFFSATFSCCDIFFSGLEAEGGSWIHDQPQMSHVQLHTNTSLTYGGDCG
jgi:hypothetical protein